MPCLASSCRCLLNIVNIVFLLLGALIIAVGIYAWVVAAVVLAWMPILIVVAGVVLIGVTVLGFCGSCYDKTNQDDKNPQNCKYALLLIYFFVILMIGLILAIAATLCLIARDKIEGIIRGNLWRLEAWLAQFPGTVEEKVMAAVEFIMGSLKVAGAIGIAVAVIILIGVIFSAYLIGKTIFRHTLTFGNLLLMGAGALLIGLGFYVYKTGMVDGKALPLIIAIAGIVIILLGVLGFLSACCTEKNSCCKCALCTYIILLCVIILLALIAGIICAVFSGKVGEMVDSMCNTTMLSSLCMQTYQFICTGVDCDPTQVTAAQIIAAIKGFVSGNLKMVAAAAIWIGCAMASLLVASFIVLSFKKKAHASKESIPASGSSPLPNYAGTQQ